MGDDGSVWKVLKSGPFFFPRADSFVSSTFHLESFKQLHLLPARSDTGPLLLETVTWDRDRDKENPSHVERKQRWREGNGSKRRVVLELNLPNNERNQI